MGVTMTDARPPTGRPGALTPAHLDAGPQRLHDRYPAGQGVA